MDVGVAVGRFLLDHIPNARGRLAHGWFSLR
jgi:hypothetical protein